MPDNRQPITNFEVARKQKAAVAIALAGASGSGKTKTALELAVGLAGPNGTIGVIDTEGRRALHYARQYKFEHCDFSSGPFTPWRCAGALEEAHARFDVVVFDSFSDEYEGEGGMLDMAEKEGAWIKTKAAHKEAVIRYIRREPRFTIFCLRAEEKVKFGKDDRGKLLITPMGWMPICEKRFMYDMTLSLTLAPETPGLPRYDLPRKLGDDFKPLFPEGRHITRDAGAGLRAWALDVDPPAGSSGQPVDRAVAVVDMLIADLKAAKTGEGLDAVLSAEKAMQQISWLLDKRPDEHKRLYATVAEERARVAGAAT